MNEVLRDTKAALRAAFLERRKAVPSERAEAWSAAAVDRLRALPEALGTDAWLVYLASKDNELNTLPLVESLLRERITVLTPVVGEAGRLLWSELQSLQGLARSSFGILEPGPECRRIVEPPERSLAVVPGIAFTREGARIGYGGGYYDRFLAHFTGPKVGLAYETQLADTLPTAAHDMPVDIVVTEAAVYRRPHDASSTG